MNARKKTTTSAPQPTASIRRSAGELIRLLDRIDEEVAAAGAGAAIDADGAAP